MSTQNENMRQNLDSAESGIKAGAESIFDGLKTGAADILNATRDGFDAAKEAYDHAKDETPAERKAQAKQTLKDVADKGLGVASRAADFIAEKARQGQQALKK